MENTQITAAQVIEWMMNKATPLKGLPGSPNLSVGSDGGDREFIVSGMLLLNDSWQSILSYGSTPEEAVAAYTAKVDPSSRAKALREQAEALISQASELDSSIS